MKKKEKVSELFWLIMMIIQILFLAFMIIRLIWAIIDGQTNHGSCSTLCCQAVSCDCKDNESFCICKYINADGVMKDTKCPNNARSRSKQ